MREYSFPVTLVIDDLSSHISKIGHSVHRSIIDLALFRKFRFAFFKLGDLLKQPASTQFPVLKPKLLFEVHYRHTSLIGHDLFHALLHLFLSLFQGIYLRF
jgi:hypothetical protein